VGEAAAAAGIVAVIAVVVGKDAAGKAAGEDKKHQRCCKIA
jgi:hypothetical protein